MTCRALAIRNEMPRDHIDSFALFFAVVALNHSVDLQHWLTVALLNYLVRLDIMESNIYRHEVFVTCSLVSICCAVSGMGLACAFYATEAVSAAPFSRHF